MTDCDGSESVTADSVEISHNGPISESTSIHAFDTTWALTSARNSVQLRVEPRNGFVCFIGLDAASCELVIRSGHGDTTIDGRQAVLVFANGAFHIKDLNSSYGVSVAVFSETAR